MPRSSKRIDSDNRALERCKGVINRALQDFTGRRQASVIGDRIQGNTVWSRMIENDKHLLRYLWLEGLKIVIRDLLAEWDGVGDPDENPPQFQLFPLEERPVVRRIGMARIWVPSLGAHVQYHPATGIAPALLKEAAQYYSGLSTGLARTANALKQLAEIREKLTPHTEAA